jgi:hypothetical protein
MPRRTLKLIALVATIGGVATAAAAGALMPKTILPLAIVVGTGLGWMAGLAVGRSFGSAAGWSVWAAGTAVGAAVATTGLIPHASVAFVGAALLVVASAILSAKAVGDSIDSSRD